MSKEGREHVVETPIDSQRTSDCWWWETLTKIEKGRSTLCGCSLRLTEIRIVIVAFHVGQCQGDFRYWESARTTRARHSRLRV